MIPQKLILAEKPYSVILYGNNNTVVTLFCDPDYGEIAFWQPICESTGSFYGLHNVKGFGLWQPCFNKTLNLTNDFYARIA
jgi:hypothetical protein